MTDADTARKFRETHIVNIAVTAVSGTFGDVRDASDVAEKAFAAALTEARTTKGE